MVSSRLWWFGSNVAGPQLVGLFGSFRKCGHAGGSVTGSRLWGFKRYGSQSTHCFLLPVPDVGGQLSAPATASAICWSFYYGP